MKTAHIADLHHNPDRHIKVMRILDQLKELAPDVKAITNSGENFHNPYTVQKAFNELLDKWGQITNITPVATIKATQGHHEKEGMVETLMRAGVVILDPEKEYFLSNGQIVESNKKAYPELLLYGSPHANASKVISKNKGIGLEEANNIVNRGMAELYKKYGAMRSRYPDVKSILVGHGVIQGKETRDLHAIKSASIYSNESDLKLAGADFYAWGHYHPPTPFETVLGGYLGSFAWSYNEIDYKPAITTVDWDTMTVEKIPLDINVKKKIWMFPKGDVPEFTKGSGCYSEIPEDVKGCDVWLVNNNTSFTEEDLKEKGACVVKATSETEKEIKIRSKEVMEAESYPDKYKAVYPDATERELQVCQEFWEKDVNEGKIPTKKVITPLWVEIFGSKTFLDRLGKETVKIDFRDYPEGLTMLRGPGGHGKSSLFDYSSMRSVLFLQPNQLVSTFELGDSYIKGEIQVNDDIYRIEMFIKPTLKSPKIEYYAFKNNKEIEGINRNRKPYDAWFCETFGSPRSYATSVLNTQFTDNDSEFQGQPINPSLIKATNIQLKELFHELAGTDLKHLALACKRNEKEQLDLLESEISKRAGVEESIPKKQPLLDNMDNLRREINRVIKEELRVIDIDLQILKENLRSVEADKEHNKTLNTQISLIKEQIETESDVKAQLDVDLSTLGSIDIADINRQLTEMEGLKVVYDSKIKELPKIQERNKALKISYDKKVSDWEKSETARRQAYSELLESWNSRERLRLNDNSTRLMQWQEEVHKVEKFNNDIIALKARIESAKANKALAEARKQEKIDQAVKDTARANKENLDIYNNKINSLDKDIEALKERISNGEEMIENLEKCPECGYITEETVAKKEKYNEFIKKYKEDITAKEIEKEGLEKPDDVVINPDYTFEDKTITDSEIIINLEVAEPKDLPKEPEETKGEDKPEETKGEDKPIEPEYEPDTIPTFDTVKYNNLKEKSSSYSEEQITEIKTKITESLKRVADLNVQIRDKENLKKEVDLTVQEDIDNIELFIKEIESNISSMKTQITVDESKISDIEKMELTLIEYDERIKQYEEEAFFWTTMKNRWGQNGVPARILEYTGPYVDELANNMLEEFYPVYKIHSETTKYSESAKKDLEVFNITVINQETGREKPLNCISGEERNFVLQALRYAFREVNKKNTLVEWTQLFEDEPDKHVCEDQLQQFWSLVEKSMQGKKILAVSHSPEIKHRSAESIDIREL